MASALPVNVMTASTPKSLVGNLPRRPALLPVALDGGNKGGHRRGACSCRGGRSCSRMTTVGDNGSPSPHHVNDIVAGIGGRISDTAEGITSTRKRRNSVGHFTIVEGEKTTPRRCIYYDGSSHPWKSVVSQSSSPLRCGKRLPSRERMDRSFLPAGISLTRDRRPPVDLSSPPPPSASFSSGLASGSSPMAGMMGMVPVRILPKRLWGTSIGRGSFIGIIGVTSRCGSSSIGYRRSEVVSFRTLRLRAFASSTGSGGGGMKADPAPPTRSGDDEPRGSRHGVQDSTEDGGEEGGSTTTSLTFVDRLPPTVRPYARLIRLDKPWGSMLLLWPCLWSTALAAPPGCPPDPTLCVLFGTGAFVMRGAGCVINDLWDSDFDRRVERTKSRPLASGELTEGQALGFLATQLALGLGVLVSLPHTGYCVKLGMASVPLVVAYPLMKRYTNWPQLVLGMTFNWGALMGWAAVHGSLDWSVVGPLYGSGIAWTLVYDTLYAHQDKVDDAKLGLRSTALHFGDDGTKPILYGFSCLSLAGWAAAGHNAHLVSPDVFYAGCAAAFGHLVWQIRTADLDDPDNLAHRFRSNQVLGGIVFASCVAGNVGVAIGT